MKTYMKKLITLMAAALMVAGCYAADTTNPPSPGVESGETNAPVMPDVPGVTTAAEGESGVAIGDAAVIIGPLLIVGAVLKNAVPQFPNRFIPLLVLIVGTVGFAFKSGNFTVNGWFTAFLVAASATGLHSGIKNSFEGAPPVTGKRFASLLLAVGVLTIMPGCQSVPPPETIATYVADARDIAELATVALAKDKNIRKDLALARDSLLSLSTLPAGKVTVEDLIAVLTKLPLDGLNSDKGQVYVVGGRIILRRFISWLPDPSVDVGASGYIQQFAGALAEGITMGLVGGRPVVK